MNISDYWLRTMNATTCNRVHEYTYVQTYSICRYAEVGPSGHIVLDVVNILDTIMYLYTKIG